MGRATFCIPSYSFKDLDKEVIRNVSRFRLCAHGLKVESYKWLGGSNVCGKCECAEVQDEGWFSFLMLVEKGSPAANQPESRAVDQPPCDPLNAA
eukprot:876936-Pelagomonas_calceolata.AAC.1